MDPQLEDLAERLPNARIRKIDMSDRAAAGPVAMQHSIRALPTLHIYDGTKLVTKQAREALPWLAKRLAEQAR